MNNRRKKSKSRRKQFKRKNSKNLKIKRKSKNKKKIMSGGGNMRAAIKNNDGQYTSVFVYRIPINPEGGPEHTRLKRYTNMDYDDPGPTDYMLPNDTVVDVIDKSEWGNYSQVAENFKHLISTPGLKGENYQIIKFNYNPSGINPLDFSYSWMGSYGLVGSDHLDYNIPPEPEPAPPVSENKEEKCERIKQLCMNSEYDGAIAEINALKFA